MLYQAADISTPKAIPNDSGDGSDVLNSLELFVAKISKSLSALGKNMMEECEVYNTSSAGPQTWNQYLQSEDARNDLATKVSKALRMRCFEPVQESQ